MTAPVADASAATSEVFDLWDREARHKREALAVAEHMKDPAIRARGLDEWARTLECVARVAADRRERGLLILAARQLRGASGLIRSEKK